MSLSRSQLPRRTFLTLAGAGATGLWLGASRPASAWQPEKIAAPAGKELVVRSESPFNAEGPLDKLANDFLTPLKHYYVRSNGAVPKVEALDYRLKVEGLVEKPLELSLLELLDKFKPRRAAATLMCAGNRRSEHSAVKKVGGLQWGPGPIGNAIWSGVALAEVLRAARLKEGAKHVWFESLDKVVEEGKTIHFGSSIPLDKALADDSGVPGAILAHRMNDERLPAEHGHPLRLVVPGFVGSRSVKWLGRIVVSDRPSDNYFVDRSYKLVQQGDAAELASTEPIYQFPLNSAICTPAVGSELKAGRVRVTGYALPPGNAGQFVDKVEVSADGGKTWSPTEFSTPAKPFCWRLWQANLTLSAGRHELVVRATDTEGNTQPDVPPWNLKGYLYNGWHRVPVTVS